MHEDADHLSSPLVWDLWGRVEQGDCGNVMRVERCGLKTHRPSLLRPGTYLIFSPDLTTNRNNTHTFKHKPLDENDNDKQAYPKVCPYFWFQCLRNIHYPYSNQSNFSLGFWLLTHTHTYIYIYIYIQLNLWQYWPGSSACLLCSTSQKSLNVFFIYLYKEIKTMKLSLNQNNENVT